jgi:hypothetical protein
LSQIEDNSNVKVLDHQGNPISLNQGAKLIADAFIDLRTRGFEAPRLAIALRKLEAIGCLYASGESVGQPPASDFDLPALTGYLGSTQSNGQ